MAMNTYRMTGDLSHVLGILVLMYLVMIKKNAAGISRKAQELYLLVFCARYLDLFTTFYSLYNSFLKIFFILSTASILFVMRFVEPAKSTYSASQDDWSFGKCTVVSCLILASLIHLIGSGAVLDISVDEMEVHFRNNTGRFNVLELLWTFSILLEVVAMLPQLLLFRKNRLISGIVRLAIGLFGAYRLCYIFNWIFRAFHEPHYKHYYLVYTCGVLQTLLYADFAYHHLRLLRRFFDQHCEEEPTSSAASSVPLLSDDAQVQLADVSKEAATKPNDSTSAKEEPIPVVV